MNDFENYLSDLFKKQREVRIKYAESTNPKKYHDETCMFNDCNNKCIQSHSISRNILKKISSNNEVIFPLFDPCNIGKNYQESLQPKSLNIQFTRKNIASSGVFRGFCEQHDNDIFQPLDNHGITTQRDIFLQLYRTTCKYCFLMKNVENSEWSVFKQYYYANPEFENKIFLPIKEIKDFLEDMLIDFPELAKPIPNTDKSFIIMPESDKFDKKCNILYRRISKDFNFAIENDLTLRLANNEIAHFIFVLLPEENYTNLLAISSAEGITKLHSNLYSEIQILNTIESIMMQNSDFYLQPEIIDKWSIEKKQIIMDDFFFVTERKPFQEYDVSIFDDLRKKIIANISEEIKKHELQKIEKLPERPKFQGRYIKFVVNITKNRQDQIRFTGNKDGKNYPIGYLIIEE